MELRIHRPPASLAAAAAASSRGAASEASGAPPALHAGLSVGEFFAAWVEPVWLALRSAQPATLGEYRRSIGYWVAATGDPPLRAIDERAIVCFMQTLPSLCTPRGGRTTASAYTIRKHCRNLQTVFNLAGPRGQHCPRAQRLLDDVPLLEAPPVDAAPPDKVYTLEEITALLACVEQAPAGNWPRGRAAAYWSATVRLAYNLGERRGALFQFRAAGPTPPDVIEFGAAIRKGRRKSHRVAVNAAARAALLEIWPAEGELLLPWRGWPKTASRFYDCWRQWLASAGIPPSRRWGLHALRRAAATQAARINPLAAQLLLGHADFATTQRHYVAPGILAEALARLPQPGGPAAGPDIYDFENKP